MVSRTHHVTVRHLAALSVAMTFGRVWLSSPVYFRRPSLRGHVALHALPEESDSFADELRRASERLTKKELQEDVFSTSPIVRPSADWTVERVDLEDELPSVGTVLLADPRNFLESNVLPAAAARTGWMPSMESSRREKARLPVVLITRQTPEQVEGVLLGSWSGKLLGDMELQHFMTRPLYIGGVNSSGLSMLHSYPEMPGSSQLTEDGLAVSEDFNAACEWIDQGPGSALRFKFFWNNVVWRRQEADEMRPQRKIWIAVHVSRDLLLREPDSSFEDPLWAQYALKAGGELKELGERFGLFPS